MPPVLFAAPPPETLLRTQLDGLTALYHRTSGQTHVLAEPLPDILDALSAQPLALGDLARALGLDPEDGQDCDGLRAHLAHLEGAGLVQALS